MSNNIFNQVFTILSDTSPDKPWMTARGIASRLRNRVDRVQIEQILLAHCKECEDKGLPLRVRYSSLPSRSTLDVLWGAIEKVGSRRLENITQDHVVDGSLAEFESLDKADVFLSHSHRDYDAVMAVATLLLQEGVVPWLAETHIGQGEHIHEQIIGALGASQAFLLFLSPHALDSRWTGKEYVNARSRGIPVFVVANIDFEEITAILKAIRGKKSPTDGFLRRFKQGAREFINNLITDEGHIIETFAYSFQPISASAMAKLHPARPLGDLPSAIRANISEKTDGDC